MTFMRSRDLVKMSNLSWRMILLNVFSVFLAFIADVVLASPSSPVGVQRRWVWKHKLIFVHGLIFPSFSSIACVLITPSRW